MGDPVTLRIEGDASGAVRAAQEAQAALQGLSSGGGGSSGIVTAYGEISMASQGMTEKTKETGAGFEINRAQSARLTQALMQLGLVPPQVAGSLRMFLASGLNPMAAGFAITMVVVQGFISLLKTLQEEQDRAGERARRTADAYIEASRALEGYLRLTGQLTGPGAEMARTEQLMMAEAGGMGEADSVAAQQAAARSGIPAPERGEFAEFLAGRTVENVGKKAAKDVAVAARWFKRHPAERKAVAEAGRRAVAEVPGMRENAMAAGATRAAEAGITPEQRLLRDMAKTLNITEEEAAKTLRFAAQEQGVLEYVPEFLTGRNLMGESEGKVRDFLLQRGRMGALERNWHGGARINVTRYGTQIVNNFGGADAPPLNTDGRPRGPQQ